MLEHLPNPLQAVFEMRRVLKHGGHLLLVLPWKDATFDQYRAVDYMQHLLRNYVSMASAGRNNE
jgi:ubiquinone/menaquinone biosynthesis C-methylase UbiE